MIGLLRHSRWSAAAVLFVMVITGCPAESPEEDPLQIWIGQMIMVGFRGTELAPDTHIVRQIKDLRLGGVVLFDYDVPSRSPLRNIRSAEQVAALTAQLQAASSIPLLIAIDQEGGRIARLKPKDGFPESRSQFELGQLNDERTTRNQAREIGALLASLGINLNFAPVLDLAVNPDNPVISRLERSYGAESELVIRLARWTIEEFHQSGVLCAVKHFPGHGSSREDSHLGLPDVSQVWTEQELVPFARLIREELPDAVMTAHLFNVDWDPDYPATLSPAVIQGMLRQQLGFDGVVVSDDMGMGAIVSRFSFEKAIELAVKAGVDLLVFGNNSTYDPDVAGKASAAVNRLVDSGEISRERIRESYERILSLKSRIR